MIYNGKDMFTRKIKTEMVGHKLGEFVPTRKNFVPKQKYVVTVLKKKMAQKGNPITLHPTHSFYQSYSHWDEPRFYYILSITINKLTESCCLGTTHYINNITVNKFLGYTILYIIYYILYAIYYILHTIYYILYTIYYILYTICYILYTIYYILYTKNYILYFMLYTIYYILFTIYYILNNIHTRTGKGAEMVTETRTEGWGREDDNYLLLL